MPKLLDAEINLREDSVQAIDFFIDRILFLLEHPELPEVEVVKDGPDQEARELIEYLGES